MPLSNPPSATSQPLIGMHGERIDWISSHSQFYHLGSGTRSYNPMLQSFLGKDPYSPFSGAGINPYTFCNGDPVNRSDPSGYMSTSAALGLGFSILGIVLSIITFGMSFAVLSGIGLLLTTSSMVLGVASGVTGAASAILEKKDPELSRTLGWVSLGLGMGSLVTGLGGAGMARAAGRFSRRMMESAPYDVELQIWDLPSGRAAAIHGTPYATVTENQLISGTALANKIKASFPAGRTDPLQLASCYAARGGRHASPAQVVANTLRVDVLASTERTSVILLQQAKLADRLKQGYVVFKPQGRLMSAGTSMANTALFELARTRAQLTGTFFR